MRMHCLLAVGLAAIAGLRAEAQEAASVPPDAASAAPDVTAATPEAARSAPGTIQTGTAAAQAADPSVSPAAAVALMSPAVATSPAARSGPVRAIDSIDLGATSITGNQELPKVLYIVPWKRSDLGEVIGRPVNTLLDEVLAPVDPEVFERHLSYYETLHGPSQEE